VQHKELLPQRTDTASATTASPIANSDITDLNKTLDAVDTGKCDLNVHLNDNDSGINKFDQMM